MTKDLQKIKEACWKANPKIMIASREMYGEECDCSSPIQLSDVLMALEHAYFEEGVGEQVYVGTDGQLFGLANTSPSRSLLPAIWELPKSLEDQKPEVWKFIASLL